MKSAVIAVTLAVAAAQPFMANPYAVRAPAMANPYYGNMASGPAYGAYGARQAYAGAYGAPRQAYGYGAPRQAYVDPRQAYAAAQAAAAPRYARPEPEAVSNDVSPTKNLEMMDMLITLRMLRGGAGANVAGEFVIDNNSGNMVGAGGSSNLLTMMMMSQGLGGTGSNQLGLYNLLNAKNSNEKKYIESTGASVTVAGNTYQGYAEAPGQGNALMSMLWGGTGQTGLGAGSLLPIMLMGGAGPTGTDPLDVMSSGILTGGAW